MNALNKMEMIVQPLFAQHPTPWIIWDMEPGYVQIRDANGNAVLKYNTHTHPGILASDRLDNAQRMVNLANNF